VAAICHCTAAARASWWASLLCPADAQRDKFWPCIRVGASGTRKSARGFGNKRTEEPC
jgi:hypothetical protein